MTISLKVWNASHEIKRIKSIKGYEDKNPVLKRTVAGKDLRRKEGKGREKFALGNQPTAPSLLFFSPSGLFSALQGYSWPLWPKRIKGREGALRRWQRGRGKLISSLPSTYWAPYNCLGCLLHLKLVFANFWPEFALTLGIIRIRIWSLRDHLGADEGKNTSFLFLFFLFPSFFGT